MSPKSKLMQKRMTSNANLRGNSSSKLQGANVVNPDLISNSPLLPGTSVEPEEQKIMRYERVIDQLQKMIDGVKKQNKMTRMQFEREIASKTELEYYLKKAVKKVMNERKKARDAKNAARASSTKFYITALDSSPTVTGMAHYDDNELSQEERERVIELLLG